MMRDSTHPAHGLPPTRQVAVQHSGEDYQAEEQLFPVCCEIVELLRIAVPLSCCTL